MFDIPQGFTSAYHQPEVASDGLWFVFRKSQLLVAPNAPEGYRLPQNPLPGLAEERMVFLGFLHDKPCYATEVPEDAEAPPGLEFMSLRVLWGVIDEDQFGLAGQAVQLIDWDRDHRYCGRCAAQTSSRADERAKRCPDCGLVSYPRISPAIMVLISRGEELLLARGPHFKQGVFSALAGFVEPGESLEQTIHREVMEEVGLEVQNLRYFNSQPWPFPNSLMIAYFADYKSGELKIDGVEIEAADWFTKDRLPDLPFSISIANRLINAWLDGSRGS